jgi:urea transport system substrate-binding protein
MRRRKFIVYGSASLGGSLILKGCTNNSSTNTAESPAPVTSPAASPVSAAANGKTIKVGILHSLSGTMAISEKSVVDAEKLAIKEINAAGGVLGKQIEAIVEDGASNWDTFREKATKLIDQDKVTVVFGCWTSASRKNVKPVFESKNHMLWYPVQYEGQECSNSIFYTGAAPNQQIEPAVDWLLKNKGKEFFLVGSDYVFPRTANTIIKAQLQAQGGKTVGEDYYTLHLWCKILANNSADSGLKVIYFLL